MSKTPPASDPHLDTYYVHFGRYEGSRDAPFPRHAFLVGQERERAHLLDLLYMKSGLGSYLVTGLRGVGKTTFIQHCINTYVRDVYERYTRSSVGRGSVDRIVLTTATVLAVCAFFVVSSVATELASQLRFQSGHLLSNVVRLAVVLPSLALCAGPAVAAAHEPARIYQKRRRIGVGGDAGRGIGLKPWLLASVLSALLLWRQGPHASLALIQVLGPIVAILALCLVTYETYVLTDDVSPAEPADTECVRQKVREGRYLRGVRGFLLGMLSIAGAAPILFALVHAATCECGLSLFAAARQPWFAELSIAVAWAMVLRQMIQVEKRGLLQPARRILYEIAFRHVRDPKYLEPHHELSLEAESTLFHRVFASWLPVVRVHVNLGLDNLSHRHIVESMLQGLRDAHGETCLRLTTTLGALRVGARTLLTLATTTLLHHLLSSRAGLLSISPGEFSYRLLGSTLGVKPFGMHLEPHAWGAGVFSLSDLVLPPRVGFADLFAACALWFFFRWFEYRLGVLPHLAVDRRIAAILDGLHARVSLQQDGARVAGEKLLQLPTRSRTVTFEPRDPRSLEQEFINVLQIMRKPHLQLLPGLKLSLPASETLFIFDELDKVGSTTTLIGGEENGTRGHSFDLERERSRKLQALLADLKNLLSTAPARFFFVGGRNLHDEWLADEASRSPLLTNIFDAEIYLRTMLSDRGLPTLVPRPISDSVRAYLEAQYARAHLAWEQWSPSAGSGQRDRHVMVVPSAYTIIGRKNGAIQIGSDIPKLRLHRDAKNSEVSFSDDFLRRFAEFLTFRSRGIPRRARLLLETFVRPYDRAVTHPIVANQTGKPRSKGPARRAAQHVLFFADSDRHRVELISEMLRATDAAMLDSLDRRNDKVITAVFQFADFIARFHAGAFSLQSLERFEELMHVHRDPDTGKLAARLIEGWLGQLLEPTTAGIYSYRFRVEWAPEVGYLARISSHESAAFNFTLDESQALKAQLRSMLATIQGKGATYEVHSGLGELHDLDGDHLEARHHFRCAIDSLDQRLGQEFVASGDGRGPIQRMFEVLSAESLRRQLDWGLTRIKLMLQIGVSYERTFDFQRAALEYGNAAQLAGQLLRSGLDTTLKSLGGAQMMLLEPVFALAWAATKDPANLESGFDHARDSLRALLGLGGHTDQAFLESLRRCPVLSDAQLSRVLTNLGDLAFFSIPQREGERMLEMAIDTYEQACQLASSAKDYAQRARCQISLALCALVGHRGEKRLNLPLIRHLVAYFKLAQSSAWEAPSGRGSSSDSLALYQLGVELAEELQLLSTCLPAGPKAPAAVVADELVTLVSPCDRVRQSRARWLPALRERMLRDGEGRASLAGLNEGPTAPARVDFEKNVFPMRNRMLNMRAAVLNPTSESERLGIMRSLLVLWHQFDNRVALAPCRIALAAHGLTRRSKFDDEAVTERYSEQRRCKMLWESSRDVAMGGKRYFAWLRDRFYVEDGFGNLLLRMNFALTVGLTDCHEELRKQLLDPERGWTDEPVSLET